MIIAELSITPLGEGISVSRYVKIALQTLKESGVKFETNAMATVIECKSIEELFAVVKKAHDSVLEAGAKRVITSLKIDDRRDKEATIETKLDSVKV
ncbi:MAG TPA: MTH1187 family thiamine-binding protein [Thermoplasmatales archaeon]|nr:MTH1187 family thiamine-binding protein [Thermoplasmatales archaeon]HEX08525.1 MTH1187 family thiamine-binding protein [Thermoplasmatales archaeon]